MSSKLKKEPLLRISRRDSVPFRKNLLIRISSVLLALVVCSLILVISSGFSPISFISSLFEGTIGNSFNTFTFLGELAILLGFGIALVPAFKMKFWNIGADGQALMGAFATYFVLYNGTILGEMNATLACIISLIAAILVGALWGIIPAIFKSFWNINETLFTLMMNYIAMFFAGAYIRYILDDIQGGRKTTIPIPEEGTLPSLFGFEQTIPIIIIIVIVLLVSIYINRTKEGYELSLVGDSQNSAKYAGISVKFVYIRTMVISGGICGIVGWLLITGNHQAVSSDITHNMGFTAIIVAWLAKFNPLYMILTAGLISFITIGMNDVMSAAGITNDALSNIFIGIIFFFIIAFEFFISYKIHLRKNDEGEIDNKLLKWNYHKVYLPFTTFINKVVDKIDGFFVHLFHKMKSKLKRKPKEEEVK